MSLKLKHPIVIITITLLSMLSIQAQKGFDLSSVNYTNMTNNQLQQLFQEASSKGYNYNDILKAAEAQGLTAEEIDTLDKRFNSLNTRASKNSNIPNQESRLRNTNYSDISLQESQLGNLNNDGVEYPKMKSDLFGFDVFKGNSLLTFQSNLNIPTPAGYILGSGDKLFIDIYGQSEAYYQIEISPEGTIILENFGPIHLSGLTVKNATKRIKNKLSKVYSGIKGNKNTFVNVSVGKSRTIKVNIVGEVAVPGSYTLSAFNTVYNAIYVAGGINENATLREIKLYRNNKLINSVDVYKFLTKGDGSSNIRLENNDLIVVGPYTNRVTISGAVKIPGKFETKENETLSDLLFYAGGLSEKAYKKSIKLTRIIDGELKIVDINSDQYDFFKPSAGDRFQVEQIIEKYNNRVIVNGAVYRPGTYSVTDGMTIKTLIDKAEGLKTDVFFDKAYVTRTNEDYSTSTIALDLRDELKNPSFILKEEDILNILSVNDLSEENYIEISGEVNNPGIFPFSENITLSDLILLAGSFKENASSSRIEINRRITSDKSNENNISEILTFDLNKNLDDSTISIKPFDQIIVRKNPNFYTQQYARVEGEVMYPGKYAISSKNERISDLINRSGGFKNMAYLKGATLIRLTEFAELQSDLNKKNKSLNDLKNKVSNKQGALTESELLLINRIDEDLKNIASNKNDNQILSSYAKSERINEILKKNSVDGDIPISKSEAIGIDLISIVNSPGSKSDLLLKEGDVIIVPKKLETVRLRGELLYPTTVRFIPNKSLKYYIDSSGGFDNKAKRSGTYIVYANGDVARTKKFLFFNIYPKAEPGSEVIVPKKSMKNPIAANQLLNFTTGLATLILAINQIN